jgi:hypothetical protein
MPTNLIAGAANLADALELHAIAEPLDKQARGTRRPTPANRVSAALFKYRLII